MKRITALAIGLCIATVTTLATIKLYESYQEEVAQITAEHDCVRELVKVVDRIDIATGNGKCWHEVNGYYK